MIYVNGITTLAQPTMAAERRRQIQETHESIGGNLARARQGERWVVDMNWQSLTPAQYSAILTQLKLGEVEYENTLTGVHINGLASYTESDYIPGSRRLRTLSVIINETEVL